VSVKKILFLCHGYKPAINLGGPIVSVSEFAEAINKGKNSYSVDIFCTTDNLNTFIDKRKLQQCINGVDVFYFNSISFYLWKLIGRKYKDKYLSISLFFFLLLRAQRYRFIHVHIPLSFLGVWGCLICRLFNIPLIYHIRGCYSEGRLVRIGIFKTFWINLVEKWICKSSYRVIALTDEERQQINNVQPKSKVFVMPNGLDPKPFNSVLSGDSRSPFNNEYILFLGRLDKVKGLDYLIESFGNVADKVNFDLVIAGPDQANYQSLVNESEKLNVLEKNGRIKFLCSVDSTKKLSLIYNAKAFFLPSAGEGFSMAILESLFLGCPVFATRECNITEIFKKKAAVEIYRDISKIELSLLYLYNNPKAVIEVGSRGMEYAHKKYDIKNVTSKYMSLVDTYGM
jgi:glycosyltransferase involved in cell wall biosynthesis